MRRTMVVPMVLLTGFTSARMHPDEPLEFKVDGRK